MEVLNDLPDSAFTHPIFYKTTKYEHLNRETSLLGEDTDTIGVWLNILPERTERRIAITIQYAVADLGKMMPHFVDQLQVPLIAIADSNSMEPIYFQDSSVGQSFLNKWKFGTNGFNQGEGSVKNFKPMKSHKQLH